MTNKKLILIVGGSASGKTTLSNMICELLDSKVTLITLDSYYKPKGSAKTNYDSPKSFDFKLLESDLKKMMNNEEINLPVYNYATFSRTSYEKVKASEYIIVEGIHTLYSKNIKNMADFKIFVETPSDTRLARRILRDIKERGRKTEDVINR
jgi:uridine kinase